MIKIESIEEHQHIHQNICLNPYCNQPQRSIFNPQDTHLLNPSCKRWITTIGYFRQSFGQIDFNHTNHLQFNLFDSPLLAIADIYRLSNTNWSQFITQQFTSIKQQLILLLQHSLKIVKQSIEGLTTYGQVYSEWKNIVLSNPQTKLNDSFNYYFRSSKKFSKLNQLQAVILYQKDSVEQIIKHIKNNINAMISKFYYSPTTPLLSAKQQQIQFYNFIHQPIQNVFGKLQSISSVMSLQLPTYHAYQECLSLKCLLCQNVAAQKVNPHNKKFMKKGIASEILAHLYSQHYGITRWFYQHKISKISIYQIKFQDVLKQVQNYEEVYIIDRQSGVHYQQSYDTSLDQQNVNQLRQAWGKIHKKYYLDIITNKNIKIAKSKYLLVSNRQTLEVIIILLIYEIQKMKKKIYGFSNTSFAEGIKQFFIQNETIKVIKADVQKIKSKNQNQKKQ